LKRCDKGTPGLLSTSVKVTVAPGLLDEKYFMRSLHQFHEGAILELRQGDEPVRTFVSE